MKKYDISQCAFYKCGSKSKLEKLLLIDKSTLNNVHEMLNYNFFSIEKDGKTRNITSPDKQLKQIQKRILKLLAPVFRPVWLISGEKGKSYIDNGRFHINSKYALTIDIKSFYDSCQREYVYRFFRDKLKTKSDIAQILTDITTYKFTVPTGSPTSQMIAYYAYENMFFDINEVAKKFGCIFSLYVDDMTFSSEKPFDVKRLKNEVDITLRRYGHKPKYSKIKYFGSKQNKLITGSVVSAENILCVPNSLREKIVIDFKESLKSGETSSSFKGRLQAAKNIQHEIFPEIARITSGMDCK